MTVSLLLVSLPRHCRVPLPCATRVLQARREEEARKAAEAEVKGAAGYAAASADVRGLHT